MILILINEFMHRLNNMPHYIILGLYSFLFFCTNINAQNNEHVNKAEIRQLIQLVEYIGVDYGAAVVNNKIVDTAEYQEMLEFSTLVSEQTKLTLPKQEMIIKLSDSLLKAVSNNQDISIVRELSSQLKTKLRPFSPKLTLPKELIDESKINFLYKENCSSCHGLTGAGDGILAKDLSPAPTSFINEKRANNRSILGLYQAISNGLDGTAMPAFVQFTHEQRWSLAFKIGKFAYQDASNTVDEAIARQISLQDFVMLTPNEMSQNLPSGSLSSIKAMRFNPTANFFNSHSSLELTINLLKKAQIAYQNQNLVQAKTLAISAYLDGFELIENALDAHNKPLRKKIEVKLMSLRKELTTANNHESVNLAIDESIQLLNQAEVLLTHGSLSNSTIFTASFIILLREGLEALLVVLALFTILVRSEHKRGRKYLHIGWVSALLAGFLTWLAAEYLIEISGASREIMEGVAALLAAIILLFVGFWMHSKSKAEQWQKYIQQNINHKLKSGSLWGIAGLAFITVYREVFETVLFYQSLILQTQSNQHFSLLAGFLFGIFILALVAWLIIKYSVKMPIAKFFSSTSYIILILAFILAGKAIAALQEAAVIPMNLFPVNISFDWLGIYPTWQGLSVQVLVLAISAILLLNNNNQ